MWTFIEEGDVKRRKGGLLRPTLCLSDLRRRWTKAGFMNGLDGCMMLFLFIPLPLLFFPFLFSPFLFNLPAGFKTYMLCYALYFILYAVLCYAVLCSAMLYYTPCCAMLYVL